MDNFVYIAMSGAEQTMRAQTINANNLANLSTTGFKADLDQFRSQSVFGDGLPSRAYAQAERPATDFSSGPLMPTGRDLDLAIEGEGWFSVQAPNGSEALTRIGNLQLTSEGLLTTANGLPLLGDGGPITVGSFDKISIGVDGTVSIVPEGSGSDNLVVIDRIRLSNPDKMDLYKDIDGLIKTKDGSQVAPDASVKVTNGFLEGSNVNAIESISKIISLAREFEAQLKMMETAKQTSQTDSSILRLS